MGLPGHVDDGSPPEGDEPETEEPEGPPVGPEPAAPRYPVEVPTYVDEVLPEDDVRIPLEGPEGPKIPLPGRRVDPPIPVPDVVPDPEVLPFIPPIGVPKWLEPAAIVRGMMPPAVHVAQMAPRAVLPPAMSPLSVWQQIFQTMMVEQVKSVLVNTVQGSPFKEGVKQGVRPLVKPVMYWLPRSSVLEPGRRVQTENEVSEKQPRPDLEELGIGPALVEEVMTRSLSEAVNRRSPWWKTGALTVAGVAAGTAAFIHMTRPPPGGGGGLGFQFNAARRMQQLVGGGVTTPKQILSRGSIK